MLALAEIVHKAREDGQVVEIVVWLVDDEGPMVILLSL
jgi:hypothetical protein